MHRLRSQINSETIMQAVQANWDYPDRLVRLAAADLVATLSPEERFALGRRARTPLQRLTYCLAICDTEPAQAVEQAGRLLAANDAEPTFRLDAVRVIQRALGDISSPKARGTVWEGYSPRRTEISQDLATQAAMVLHQAFPASDPDLDRELSRTLAILEDNDADLVGRVAGRLTADSHPVEDIHYLIVLARLCGPRSATTTKRVADSLLALGKKLTQRSLNRDSNWPLRLAELHAELARKDARLNAALLAASEFGRPDHALFAECPGFDRARAAAMFLARAAKDADF